MNTTRLYHLLRAVLVALVLAAAWRPALAENRSDLWWNPAEAGRGLIVIDHETDLFVVWCTYNFGYARWFTVPGGTLSADGRTFEGALYETNSDVSGDATIKLGTAKIDFAPEDLPRGWARYTIRYGTGQNVFVETHDLTRQTFGSGAPAWGADATDIWWDPSNPLWGVAAIQHGADDIFGILLTYDRYGNPTFFVSPSRPEGAANSVTPGTRFGGPIYGTRVLSGPSGPFNPAAVEVWNAGSASMRFSRDATGFTTQMEFSTTVRRVGNANLVRLPFGAGR